MEGKICSRCKTYKPYGDYFKTPNHSDGLYSACKDCHRQQNKVSAAKKPKSYNTNRMRDWRAQNPEQNLEAHRRWARNNPEKAKTKDRKWKEANKDKTKERDKQRWLNPTEEMRESRRRYDATHTEGRRARYQKRRARTKGVGGVFSAQEWKDLCLSYGNRCLCCGTTTDITADHIIPISQGGANTINNIQPLCRTCNSRKGIRIINYRTEIKDDA